MKRIGLVLLAVIFCLPGLRAQAVEDFYACPCRARAQVDSLVAATPTDSLAALLERVDRLYFDPASDDYCEGIMAMYLRAALPRLADETERDVAQWKLEAVCDLNAEGSEAPDFNFDLLDGPKELTFKESRPKDGRLCLLFYDPDCGHCSEVIGQLRDLPVSVMAVCVDSTPERWAETASALPEVWIKAFDRSEINENEIYMLRSLPGIYLLDAEGRVELKNPSVRRLINYLNQ